MPAKTKNSYRKKSLARRVAYLERKQWERRPEMKYFSSSFTATAVANNAIVALQPCDINYGDGNNNRVGNEILVHAISIRGSLVNTLGEIIVCIGNGAQQFPLTSDFDMVYGGGIRPASYKAYRTVAHIQKTNDSPNFVRTVRFKKPLRVAYEGGSGTDCVDNVVWVVFKNQSGVSLSPTIYMITHYTDP